MFTENLRFLIRKIGEDSFYFYEKTTTKNLRSIRLTKVTITQKLFYIFLIF